VDLVAVDIGNTRINSGLFRQGVLTETWQHATTDPRAAARAIAGSADKAQVAICSVVPDATVEFRQILTSGGSHLIEIGSGAKSPLKGSYDTLGADRIANAVAAWKLYGKQASCLVIDLGTATTLTAVGADGSFKGGFITLGVGPTLTHLHQAASQLPRTTMSGNISRELAFDTESAIINGTFLAQIGIIESWLRLARRAVKGEIVTIATGGWCETIARHTASIDMIDPQLTLKGIYLIAESGKPA
jgi:type III pantothenate kinase